MCAHSSIHPSLFSRLSMRLQTVQQLPFADSRDCVPLRPGPVALALRVLCAGTLASLAVAAALAPQPARAQAAAQQGAAQRLCAIPAGPLETVLNRRQPRLQRRRGL